MLISRVFQAIKLSAIPLLFAAAALGLATVHVSLERKAERARNRAAHAVALQNGVLPDKLVGLKLQDLASAAQKGDIPAEVEMARRLALGEGIKKNEGQAALYFQAVINQLGEISAHDKRGPLAATAFRYLAQYHRHGLPEANIPANPALAFDLLHHAASYFGDPIAQYELAKLLISGDGVSKNPRGGVLWLGRATRKGYVPAQALLGEMLWRGDGVERAPGDGLGLLAIARRNASPSDKVWVSEMFEAARAEALPMEILQANAFIVQESGASPFGAAGSFIDGLGQEGETTGSPSAGASGHQGAAVNGNSQSVSSEGASKMLFTPGGDNRELNVRKSDSKASAGIIQMYRLWELEARGDNSGHIRVAGVSK